MMSKVFLSLLLFLAFIRISNAETERITDYHSDIQVNEDGSLNVTERITVVALGVKIRRGIYRTFPVTYKDNRGNRYKVSFEVLKVLRDGHNEPYHIKSAGNKKMVYIGDPDVFLDQGKYTYTIEYKTTRQIGFFEDFDELYWNVTGNEWDFVIERASATIHLPEGANVVQHAAYSGPFGSKTCDCTTKSIDDETIEFVTTKRLLPGHGLTVAVAWPKGIVKEPTKTEKLGFFLRDNLSVLMGLIGLIVVFLYYLYAWDKVGRDPKKGTIIPLFHPPEGFSPAAVRYVLKMRFDDKAFTASIVDMAVKGYLKIRKEHKEYYLDKADGTVSSLSGGEKALGKRLFRGRTSIKLDNENYVTIGSAKRALNSKLRVEFQKANFNLNYKYMVPGILLSLLFFAGMYLANLISGAAPVLVWPIVAAFVVTTVVFFVLIKAPTVYGRKIMDQIEGFKMYLSVADKERLDKMNPPDKTPELFEKYLPYAIALGVETAWGRQFNEILARATEEGYRPTWYVGTGYIAYSAISHQLGASFSSALSTSASPPGSSSGSGGGGFSGGGGGGGGGGGW